MAIDLGEVFEINGLLDADAELSATGASLTGVTTSATVADMEVWPRSSVTVNVKASIPWKSGFGM